MDAIVRAWDAGWVRDSLEGEPARQADAGVLYRWRKAGAKVAVTVLVKEFGNSHEAAEYVRHGLVAIPMKPLQGVGDVAVVAYAGGPATVHFSVDQYYVQLTAAGPVERTIALAAKVGGELRRP
jgi:hypothetical protein